MVKWDWKLLVCYIHIVYILINYWFFCFPERRWKIRFSWSITCWTRWMRWSSVVEWPSPSWKSSTTWRWGGSGSVTLYGCHSFTHGQCFPNVIFSYLRPTLELRHRARAVQITVVKLLCSVSLKKKVGLLPSRLTSETIFKHKLMFKKPVHSNTYFFNCSLSLMKQEHLSVRLWTSRSQSKASNLYLLNHLFFLLQISPKIRKYWYQIFFQLSVATIIGIKLSLILLHSWTNKIKPPSFQSDKTLSTHMVLNQR